MKLTSANTQPPTNLPFLSNMLTSQNSIASHKLVKIVDLFAGVGGFHYGIKEAAKQLSLTVDPILTSEIERTCQNVYKNNFQCDLQGDINQIELNDAIRGSDILTAGFPCQPFSNSGKKLGLSDPRGQFYYKIEEIIRAYNTKAFILENVPGIKKNGGGSYKSELSQSPRNIGKTMRYLEENLMKLKDYKIIWEEINSSHLGSPQVRKRVFIVGIHKDLHKTFDFTIKEKNIKPFITISEQEKQEGLELSDKQVRNIKSVMCNPPSFTAGMRRVGQAYLCPGGNVGQCYHSHGLLPTLTKVWARFFPVYFPNPEEVMPEIENKNFTPNEFYGSGYIRKISVREAYRLQGFPESFIPDPNSRIAYEHAGNAVNVKVVSFLVSKIFRDILN